MRQPQQPRLRIRGWNETHENNRSRELSRTAWFSAPNDLSADRYVDLVTQDNGAAHFGAWTAILMVASRCKQRGLLVREDGRAHTAASLATITRMPEALMATVLAQQIERGALENIDEKPRETKRLASHPDATRSHADALESHRNASECRSIVSKERMVSDGIGSDRNVLNGSEAERKDFDPCSASPKNLAKTAQASIRPVTIDERFALTKALEKALARKLLDSERINDVLAELKDIPVSTFIRYIEDLSPAFKPGGKNAPKKIGFFVSTARNLAAQQTHEETPDQCRHGKPWNACCNSPAVNDSMTGALD